MANQIYSTTPRSTWNKGVNPDLDIERQNKSFDVEKLTNILDGGAEFTQKRRQIESIIYSDPVFTLKSNYFMSQNQRYEAAVQKAVHYKKLMKQRGWKEDGVEQNYIYRALAGDTAFNIHSVFQRALRSLGSEEQIRKWGPLTDNFQIIVTYAQTEMGHGTYLQGLETTATYDASTQEFVLNTPTLSATKWWPGDLGRTATHALILAQLYCSGRCHGMHAFLVPIRSLQDHSPLPGITVGDIGPKMNFEQTDNGFLQLDHVRIPRENMLNRFSQVLPDGTYVKQGTPQSNYFSMIVVRVQMLPSEVISALMKACVIATRYSVVRRQSKIKPSEPEVKILDYQTQQEKLFPQLARAYAFHFIDKSINEFFKKSYQEILNGNAVSLPELHVLSAGMKAMLSDHSILGAEVCRRACGGHGYSLLSGLPSLVTKVTASCTYEGENTVMYLQTARYLVKSYLQAQPSQGSLLQTTLPQSIRYLTSTWTDRCLAQKAADFLSPAIYIEAYAHVAARLIRNSAHKLHDLTSSGTDQHVAWNQTTILLVQAAKAHCYHFTVKTFVDSLRKLENEPEIYHVIKRLCDLYALHGLLSNLGDFLHDGYMSGAQADLATATYLDLLSLIRKDAVLLTDAFDFSDESLNSALGCYDGNAYERLFEWAQLSPTNTEGNPAYEKYLRPFLKSNQSKL
ncbi:peroxisomal acyl-coenzyme A oxidase 2 isoform X2 [Trichosurus vulpecula]|nr:peroxisomal acyl-coenzyme A oxidase 2 isoform X2 [Trichosurus vulpecula]XP_036594354.1 peroxisomal acyl-coenzyme A oxidase 2 isoform X2 [Trichosurus vulpecula]